MAQTAPAEFEVPGTAAWIGTGLELRAGDKILIKAAGTLTLANGNEVGPAGAKRGFRDLIRNYPVNSAGEGAMIARLGDTATSQPFLVAEEVTYDVLRNAELFLGINKSGTNALQGSFKVTVEFVSRGPEEVSQDYQLPEVTLEMIDRIPRRVVDAEGNEGDNSNFVIVGPEEKIVQSLKAAGWVQVDRSNEETVVAGVLAVLNKDAYLTIPMSELMMFGRVQDYGFAHADPIMVAAERHHFRLWKAPFDAGGREVWVGAGTHDIGFDRDQRNNGITHKIDPDVDKERDYIGASLEETGAVAKTEYIMPSQPNKEALTATGGSFFSDGRLLVIHLKPDPSENIHIDGNAASSAAGQPPAQVDDQADDASRPQVQSRAVDRPVVVQPRTGTSDRGFTPQPGNESYNIFEGLIEIQ